MYITIVGLERYLNAESHTIGQKLFLKKETENRYDDEAIKVETETGVTCGYVANSVNTVARGTHSAGYIYKEILEKQKCEIIFIIDEIIIAKLIND